MAPSGSAPKISALRSACLLLASAAAVYAFFAMGWVDTSRVRNAFRDHPTLLGLNVLCLLGLQIVAVLRHHLILSKLAPARWRNVAAANVLSQAIGQWAPGSMAVSELLRVGLLFGNKDQLSRSDMLSRLASASLIDRAIGVGTMFLAGGGAAAYLVTRPNSPAGAMMWLLCAGSLILGLALLSVALLDPSALAIRLTRLLPANATGPIGWIAAKARSVIERVTGKSPPIAGRTGLVFKSGLLSTLAIALSTTCYFLCTCALGQPLPWLLLAAILPLGVVAMILPIGFAGFGGPQLIIAAQFALFGVSSEQIIAMTLVQNTVGLAVQSALGLAWLPFYGHTLSALLRQGDGPKV